ncbi:phosphatase PAP2 family protein [Thermoleophilia bacterium SCSIO 60948]|nr:phosphatase PAP2 family protein [Thermoleophilia bacterium SCSIO 60948]
MSGSASGPRAASIGPLLGLWAGCVVMLAALYGLLVRTEAGQRLDGAAIDGRRLAGARGEQAADALLGTIDITSIALALIAIATVATLRRRPAAGAVAAAALIGALVTTEALKSYVLPRPDLLGAAFYDNSFPSGHATIAMAVGVAALLVAAPGTRRPLAIAAALFAGGVGAATVALGWHRPSDVAGAYLVATGWGAFCAAVATGAGLSWSDGAVAPTGWRFERRVALGALAVLGLAFAITVVLAVTSRIDALELRLIDAAFAGAAIGLLAVAGLLIAVLLWALDRALGGTADR